MRSSNWLENVDEDIIAPAIPSTTTSRRKFGTVLSSNSLPSHPPHKDLKKDLPPKRSSRAKNPLPSLPQILQQTISARLGSPLLQNLRTLLLRCDRNEFPTSINGFILPTPSEVDFLDLLLALQFQWREKSLILPHDLVCIGPSPISDSFPHFGQVPELKKALSSLSLEPAATEPKKPKRMVKPPKPKKERSSPPAALSVFLASSDSPPHLPQPLLSEQVRQAPKWRSREVLAEEDESEMRTRRDKRRSPLWKEMIEESSASEVIEESPSGEVSQETKEISTKVLSPHPSSLTLCSSLLSGSPAASHTGREAILSQFRLRTTLLQQLLLTPLPAVLDPPAAPCSLLPSAPTSFTTSSTPP
jgi:hypothetical protein